MLDRSTVLIILSLLRSLKAIRFLDCRGGLCWNSLEKRTDSDWLRYSERFATRVV
jgi:hypothetical protein